MIFDDQEDDLIRQHTAKYVENRFGEAPVPQAPKIKAPRQGAENFGYDFINKSVSNFQYDHTCTISNDSK